MADKSSGGVLTGLKKTWKQNPRARTGMLLGFALVGALIGGSYVALKTGNSTPIKGPAASARVVEPPTGLDNVTGKTPEGYKQLVREADQERSQNAAAKPTSMVLPRVTGMADPEQQRREEEARLATERGKTRAIAQGKEAAQNQPRTTAQQAGATGQQVAPVDPNVAVRQSDEYRVTLELLKEIRKDGLLKQGAFGIVMAPAGEKEKVGATKTSLPAAGASAGSGANPSLTGSSNPALINPPRPLMRAGEVLFANTDIALNSDYSGPITATIREGKFNGARLMGQKALERNAVVIRFNVLSPADGSASFPIQAYAVALGDAKSFGLTGLQGDTDYHMFERYVLPGAISFVQAFGLSAAQNGSTAVVNNGGVGTTTPGLTNSDRLAVALGSSMTPLINDIRQRGNRPITVSLPAGTEIGIMFGADVQNPAAQRQAAALAAERAAVNPSSPSTSSLAELQRQASQAQLASSMQTQAALQGYAQQSMGMPGAYGYAQPTPYGVAPYAGSPYGAQGYGVPGAYQGNPYAVGGYR